MMNGDMEKILACRSCGSSDLKSFFDLGEHPLANSLLKDPNEAEQFYPLSLSWCGNCELVQLNETIRPSIMFRNYPWVTGTSKTVRDFSQVFSELALKKSKKDNPFVLEVASNDGTFLMPFIKKGCRVLGVDPAENIVEIAVKNGVPTLPEFFNAEISKKILEEYGPADIVVARNVLYHLANLQDVMKGIEHVLADDGVLIVEFHYAGEMLKDLHYDSIYHEHVCYYTLKTFEGLLKRFGLYAFDLDISPINSGGLIVYVSKIKSEESEALKLLHKKEEVQGVNEFKNWEKFAKRALEHKEKLLEMLKGIEKGSTIIGWGASTRSSTLLNFCGVDSTFLPAIIDMNPLRQGLYTAGTHILITSAEEGMARNPNIIFILAWNFADEISGMLKDTYNFKGSRIIPLPNEPRIIK
ncbi:hypothetical protein A2739_03440 [Candidatus Giovannonibacteria bacterium RIFCSPHIGHO2_01_FULL_43_100]|uniref:Methyltransferase n=1 Tax=Candidatus Giovannonibacteria bacterium RIFCSPHIGHO2_12_FULL_43_15 TaxID=1798341 RepID=A0A1F5WP08_9BACT|nr:MAG: hypothetical protein A2739_03440 [Candidatus Giovannonibacteria bacterium RIFCSPHIGHO2_01_FULL_43_100]OGF77385.1 MAG: hypothetical protein A3F23_00355 [Candidatus Giovannonibacteria bacterium RIFCSPHIGHO2_12_FULL_43_15]